VAVVAAAVSVYALLVGGGLLVLRPERWGSALATLGLSLVAVPVWWKHLWSPGGAASPEAPPGPRPPDRPSSWAPASGRSARGACWGRSARSARFPRAPRTHPVRPRPCLGLPRELGYPRRPPPARLPSMSPAFFSRRPGLEPGSPNPRSRRS